MYSRIQNTAQLLTDLGYGKVKHAQVGRFIGQHHVENETSSEVADDQRPDGQRDEYSFPRHRIILLTFRKQQVSLSVSYQFSKIHVLHSRLLCANLFTCSLFLFIIIDDMLP